VRIHLAFAAPLLASVTVCALGARAAETGVIVNPPPTAQQYADLAKLPDWSGVWIPVVSDQFARIVTDPTPWNEKAAREVAQMVADEEAGRPRPLFVDCLPEGMPAWMLVSHDALEILFTPGRVTLLGATDGNRLRRIYTDGRPHPDDPDPTFHGHSIGHWEGDTLVVDTVALLPQVYVALGEGVGVANNGDMHIVERMHLVDNDYWHNDLEIDAPKILTRPWKTTRIFTRQRARKFDIVEGVCIAGNFSEGIDADGNAKFVPFSHEVGGNP
jgi:hypothetical protein